MVGIRIIYLMKK